jgi:hypothetical protein
MELVEAIKNLSYLKFGKDRKVVEEAILEKYRTPTPPSVPPTPAVPPPMPPPLSQGTPPPSPTQAAVPSPVSPVV